MVITAFNVFNELNITYLALCMRKQRHLQIKTLENQGSTSATMRHPWILKVLLHLTLS